MATKNNVKTARGRGRPFQKGVSGNPKGRPQGVPNHATRDIRTMAQALTFGDPRYVTRLRRQLRAGTCPPMIEAKLLEYGYGRPVDRVERADSPEPFPDLIPFLDRAWRERNERLAQGVLPAWGGFADDPREKRRRARASLPARAD